MIRSPGLPLYTRYLLKHYIKNILIILFGLSLLFSSIDYLQQIHKLDIPGNAKILYIYYKWQESLVTLYPLAIVFALIMTKISFVKHANMVALHAFGYSKQRLVIPFIAVSVMLHLIFVGLHMTSFSYANDRARYILQNEKEAYDVNDLFFKYRDQFVYIRHLDPVKKEIEDLTLFKVNGYRVAYTIKAPFAKFDTSHWYAENAVVKTHLYEGDQLVRYKVEFKEQIKTLEAYEPQVIKSLYEGKSLTVIDSFRAWRLLTRQGVNSDKIRAVVYNKILLPLFAIGLVIILFFKLPMHGRLANMGRSIASSIAMTIVLWGVLYGFSRLGMSAAVKPEIAIILPISFFLFYALFLYKTDQHL